MDWDCTPEGQDMIWKPPSTAENIVMSGRWYHRINQTGQVMETDVLVCPIGEWEDRPQSKDGAWRPIRFEDEGLIVAVKVLL
jgi:hypothetical protein